MTETDLLIQDLRKKVKYLEGKNAELYEDRRQKASSLFLAESRLENMTQRAEAAEQKAAELRDQLLEVDIERWHLRDFIEHESGPITGFCKRCGTPLIDMVDGTEYCDHCFKELNG